MRPKILKYDNPEKYLPNLEKASKHVPKWWKDGEAYISNKKPFDNKGLKLCVPFLEAITFGYMITTPCDIVVQVLNGNARLIWPDGQFSIDKRETSLNPTIPVPEGHYSDQYTWMQQTSIELPSGYSAIYTQPLNRHDLPFTTLSGIIDLDSSVSTGKIPFYLKKNFEGVVPQGTPIIQIIPFKRDDWKTEYSPGLFEKSIMANNESLSLVSGWYKKNRWHKKTFE